MENKKHCANLNKKESIDSLCCRICQTSTKEVMISPCFCKGSMQCIHRSCLEQWLNLSNLQKCEVCNYQFHLSLRRRYGCCESVCIWSHYPEVILSLRTDCVLICVLTLFMFTLCSVWYFILMLVIAPTLDLTPPKEDLMRDMFIALSVFTLLFYLFAVVIIAKDHVVPWYHWWSSRLYVKLLSRECLPVLPHVSLNSNETMVLCSIANNKSKLDVTEAASLI